MNIPPELVTIKLEAAKETAIAVVLAALIKHHPNRDKVLATLREAHVAVPVDIAGPEVPAELSNKIKQVFQSQLSMIREIERCL